MANVDPDWWTRGTSIAAIMISAGALIWTRVDKWNERRAQAQSLLPTTRPRWNSKVDNDGFYTLLIGLRDVDRGIKFTEARLIRPRRGSIATWNGSQRGLEGKKITVGWQFTPLANPTHGGDAATVGLHFKPKGPVGDRIEIELIGRMNEGTLVPIKMRVAVETG